MAPGGSTAAPYGRHRPTVVSDTPFGMTTVAGAPSRHAAYETPCAWLPADAATTPRARAASSSDAILLSAPRTLNVRVGLKVSIFRRMSASSSCDRYGERSIGARGR